MDRTSKVLMALAVAACAVHAHPATIIEALPVGNPGNPGDTRYPDGEVASFGGVSYTYYIGKYEVTAGQYTAFLNAVAATDTYGLYNRDMWVNARSCRIDRAGAPGSYTYSVAPEWADRPVNWVSWGDAARFANWLHNGQPNGAQDLSATEDGSYYLNGATSYATLMAVVREPDATWVIPSEDEWYKAAYHEYDGVTGNYFDYPTSSDSIPSNELVNPDPGNHANFCQPDYTIGNPYYRTEVGEFENSASPYGTFDQGGNIYEWNETVWHGAYRVLRGGSFDSDFDNLHAATRSGDNSPTDEFDNIGFRVAEVPRNPVGDLNCDGVVDFRDINPFILALTNGAAYDQEYPECDRSLADINQDGYVDFGDINPFVMLLSGG